MPEDVLKTIRSKYPQYDSVDDSTLARAFATKYPQYEKYLTQYFQPAAPPAEKTYGERVGEAFSAPGESLNRALEQVKTNPIAGVANVANAFMQLPGALASPITEAGIPVVSEGTRGVLEAIPAGVGGAVGLGTKGIGAALGAAGVSPETIQNPFPNALTPEQAQEAAQAMGNLSTGVALVGAPKVLQAAKPLAGKVAGAVARKVIPENIPRDLYGGALKPPYTAKGGLAQLERQIKTGLEEGIPVSRKGLAEVRVRIDKLNQYIADAIDSGKQAGDKISVPKVVERLDELKTKYQKQANPQSDLLMIESVKENFLKHPDVVGGELPVSEAQAIKVGTYQQLNKKYGELSSATVESEKSIARGLKEELAQKYPWLNRLNAKDGAFIELEKALEKRVADASRNGLPIFRSLVEGGMIGGATGKATLGLMGVFADLTLNNPNIKSKLAIAFHRARKLGKATPKETPAFLLGTPAKKRTEEAQ